MAFNNAQYIKNKREERREKQLCIDCGQPNDQYPKWTCAECAKKRNRRARKYRINKKLG